MVRQRRPPQWHLALTLGLLVAAIGGGIYLGRPMPPAPDPEPVPASPPTPVTAADARSFAESLHVQVDSVLGELGIPPAQIDKRRSPGGLDEIRVRVPQDLPLASVNLHLTRLALWQGGDVVRGAEVEGPAAVDLTCGVDGSATTVFRLRRDESVTRRTGRIAIVVDATHAALAQRRLLERLCGLPQPLTLVVSPASREDEQVARWAAAGPCELAASVPVDDQGLRLDAGQVGPQLWAVAQAAADRGRAVAVARLGDDLLPALRAVLPRLELRGYRFATISDLDR